MIVHRVVAARWKDDIWSGTGALAHDGRWHTKGHRMVYTAESLALATMENLVHLRRTRRMKRHYKSWAEIPDKMIETFPRTKLPPDWNNPEYPESTKQIGDAWLDAITGLALRVPSATSPSEWDILINPAHRDFKKVRILGTEVLVLDPRLLKK
jgi:RES domain-containing protein